MHLPSAIPGEAELQLRLLDVDRDEDVRVRVRDVPPQGAAHAPEWKEATRVGGWDWRDGQARLERVCRRLGRRIAELLLLNEMVSALPRR